MIDDEVIERPFLQPVSPDAAFALPDGWVTRPVGNDADQSMEVAFDPSRHDVAVVWRSKLAMPVRHEIAAAGWRPLACTDNAQVWSRDRSLAISGRLRSTFRRPARGAGVAL